MQALRVAALYLRLALLAELQYRVNFFVRLFQSLLALATGLVVLGLVFAHTDELNGWSQPELLVVLGVHIGLGGVIRAAVQPNMERLIDDVRDGKLDHLLTKPQDAQLLASVREVRIWSGIDLVTGGIVVGVGLSRLETGVGPVEALAFAVTLVLGATMIYCFWLVLATGAFWLVRVHFIVELFEGVYQTGRWPVTIYPGWLRYSVTFLVPIAFAVTVPAQAVTSRLEWTTLAGAAALAAGLFAFARWFWGVGLRRYSGASA